MRFAFWRGRRSSNSTRTTTDTKSRSESVVSTQLDGPAMNWLAAIAKTLGPRVIGAAAAGVSAWVLSHTKGLIHIDPNEAVKVALEYASYAAAHRAASSIVNPADAAKGRIADAGKVAADTGSAIVVKPSK